MAQEAKIIPTNTSAGISWDDLKIFVLHEITLKNTYIINILKNYYMYTNDRRMELLKDDEERRSNLKSPLTNMFVSKVANAVKGMDMRFVATDNFIERRTEAEKRVASEMLDIMDYVWKNPISHNSFKDAIDDAVLFWWGIYKISYKYFKKNEKVVAKGWGEDVDYERKTDTPIIYYVSPLNFFIDPGAKSMGGARFMAERKLMTDDEILEEYGFFGIELNKKVLDGKENNTVSQIDYESIKRNMPYYNSDIKRDITSDKTYNIKKKTREVLEVSSKDWVTLYINWEKFWPYGQIWPNKWYRYKIIQYKKNSGTMFALWLGHMIAPIQAAYDKILNTRQDNVTLVGNKMFLYNDAFNISWNSRRLKLKPWMLHKVTDLDGIKELNTWDIKESQYAETNALFAMLQAFTGVSSNWLGLQDKVERTAGGAETLQNAIDDALKPLTDSIIENMAITMKEVLILARYYMDEDTIDSILGKDNVFKNFDIDLLINDFDFDFYMESQSHKKSAVERQQLLTLLQTLNWMVDAAGRPVMDVKEVAQRIWDGYDMEWDPILNNDKFEKEVGENEDFKTQLQQKAQQAQQQPSPQPWQAAPGQTELRQLQQLGWANLPSEVTSNSQWV